MARLLDGEGVTLVVIADVDLSLAVPDLDHLPLGAREFLQPQEGSLAALYTYRVSGFYAELGAVDELGVLAEDVVAVAGRRVRVLTGEQGEGERERDEHPVHGDQRPSAAPGCQSMMTRVRRPPYR